jgi:RNA polymerase sigma factor (sigma-70 family)
VTGSNNPKRYSPEFKDEAAKMVVDLSRPITQVAEELGINRTTLGFWVKAYRQHQLGDDLPIDTPDQARNGPDETADIADPSADITGQPADITGPSAVSGDNAERAELTRRISAALAGLDHDEREVIELYLRHDLDIADLATVLGMPRNRVDALASRGRGKLERALGALLVARMGREACPALDTLLADWDGRLTTLTAPTRYLVTQHLERCETCEKSSRSALRAALLSAVGPPAPLPSGLREQVLNLGAGRSPDAAEGRPEVIQRADSRPPNGLAGPTRLLWWRRIRDNPGAATATGAIALWGMAALSAVLILLTGGRAVGDLAVHIGNDPVATASAPASPSSGASAGAPASSSPSASSPPSAGVPAPAAALVGTPTAPGTPAVPRPQASPAGSPKPSKSAFPSPSTSSSPSQTPTPVRSSTPPPRSTPSPSPSPSSSPSPSPSPSLSPSSSSTRTRRPRPRPSHSRSPSPPPSFSTATPSPTTSPSPDPPPLPSSSSPSSSSSSAFSPSSPSPFPSSL